MPPPSGQPGPPRPPTPVLATWLVRVEIIDVFGRRHPKIACGALGHDAPPQLWKVVLQGSRSLVASAHRLLKAGREWSRPIRVAGHAIADVRKSKAELIAENALLHQQLIAAKRHLGRPELAKPEKLAITAWARLSSQWQSTMLLL